VSDYKPTAADVKRLREATMAGMMDCRNALEESGGDMDAAVKLLREKGIASAGKRSGRGTGEGVVATYVHAGGKIGAMVEVGCETDFVGRNEQFQEFARKVAMQVASSRDVRFVSADEITDDFKAAELEIYRNKALADGRPEAMVSKIAEGMFEKALADVVLLNQASIRPDDDGKTIETLRAELSGTIGENIVVKRFARFEVGVEDGEG
jgi:elongation factor Ts